MHSTQMCFYDIPQNVTLKGLIPQRNNLILVSSLFIYVIIDL